ncbi:MAG: peptide deformylase [Bacteroidales bacterium]|nr:peptide deformylase [Bacteroidales bacterium]
MKHITILSILLTLAAVATSCRDNGFSEAEKTIINSQKGNIMRLTVINNTEDSLLLRQTARTLSADDITSDTYQSLKDGMLMTVNDPNNKGVGIAAPQVGISCKLVAVKRFDKEGEPFELYPNATITYRSASQHVGREGCLSIPERRGLVSRADTVVVSYTDEKSLSTVLDTVTGYTAVIFQHETDHLIGELYIDKMEKELYVDTLALRHPEYLPDIELGTIISDFKAPDINGKEIRLSDYSGKFVVVDFWATWCGDCRREMPEFKNIYNEFKDKNILGYDIAFLSYSFDRDGEQWRKYVKEQELTWPQISTLEPKWHDIAVTQEIGIHWIPAFLIIAPDRTVIAKAITAASLRDILAEAELDE